MRIGFLTTSFPRFDGDVAGVFVGGMARALAARGHQIEVLAPEPSEPCRWSPGDGIRVHRVPYLRPRALQRTFYGAGAPENLARDPLAWVGTVPFGLALGARALAHVSRWDAIVSHWLIPCGLAGAAARALAAVPHLAVSHSADTHLLQRLPGRSQIARRLLAGVSEFLFASSDGRDRFGALLDPEGRSALGARAHVGAMGIDTPEPRTVRDRARLRRARGLEGFVLLVLSRLVPIKGIADLALALGGETGVTVLVAGDGPERERIRSTFAARGVPAMLLGMVSGPEKRDLLAVADALVVPSRVLPDGRTEGAPTAALEAMAAGLPVIATRVGGLSAIVPDGQVGILVPPMDAAALRAAILALRDDRQHRRALGKRAARHARQYLWQEIAPHIEGLLTGSSSTTEGHP